MMKLAACLRAAVAAVLVATPSGVDATTPRTSGLVTKKATAADDGPDVSPPPLLATLVQTHTDERVPLDDAGPSNERFSALLADRVTGQVKDVDPRLLGLLRALTKDLPGARIELVSGYRSAKLNEMMRKKGHHVASHSQHSLGHAVDFRVVLPDEDRGMHPRELEARIRALGWEGGVGTYLLKSDWFVHADVGPNRRWGG
jgi:uncharacterized protein YcbK (DUF882 family)